MTNPISLENKSALVTGGSKGIGYAVAEALVGQGAHVVITARNEGEVKAAAGRLNALGGGRAVGVPADVRVYDQIAGAVGTAVAEFGGLDALVANAGVGAFAPVQEMELETWHAILETNLTGAFYSLRAATAALEARSGYAIFISSLAGKTAFAGGAAYNASKFGLNGFAEAAMLDLRPLGIKVSTILPGSVATGFGRQPGGDDAWKIQPEDLAQIVLDLLTMNPRTLPSRVEVRPSRPKGS